MDEDQKKNDDPLWIGGHGKLRECHLTQEWVDDFTSEVADRGSFIRFYEIGDEQMGGHIIGGELTGRMFEYENVFVVIWSCGEYIDVGVFWKNPGKRIKPKQKEPDTGREVSKTDYKKKPSWWRSG